MIVYGTKIDSDVPFPLELPETGAWRYELTLRRDPPDALRKAPVHERFLFETHGRDVYFRSDRAFDVPVAGQPFAYKVGGVVQFYWYYGERTIYYTFEGSDNSLLAFWFIHPFLPLFMTMEKMFVFFHTAALQVEGKSILFVAPYKQGKSTLADFFVRKGHRLLCDDVLPTFIDNDGRVLCSASFPYRRPFRGPETLGIYTRNYAASFQTVDALFVLDNGAGDESVGITEIRGVEKFTTLREHGMLFTLKFLHLDQHEHLLTLLDRSRVFRLRRPWGMEYLGDVYDKLMKYTKDFL